MDINHSVVSLLFLPYGDNKFESKIGDSEKNVLELMMTVKSLQT